VLLGLLPLIGYLLGRTPVGFRIKMLGLNPDATKAVGVPTERLILLTMLFSGGAAGLAGAVQVTGAAQYLSNQLSNNFGFTAIVVALLGRLSAWGVLAAALLIAFLNVGGQAMSVDNGLPYSIVLAIEGVFVLFVLVADRFGRRS
jgi:simple sugar transport system permease protein